MRAESRTEALRWLKQAERDLDDAAYLLDGDRYSLCCFVAQQSAEKALKAFLFAQGRENVWGHSVADLCGQASACDRDFEAMRARASSLDQFYIPTRYPNGLPGGIPGDAFLKEDAERALAIATEVWSLVSGKLK